MARLLYAATPADYVVNSATGLPQAGVTVTVYTAVTGGTQVTDLLTAAGAAIETVTTDSAGGFRFQGPDGEEDTLWVSTGGASRFAVNAADLGATRAPLTHTHGTGNLLDTDGFLALALLPDGVPLVVDKVKAGGTWPSRPTARTDVPVIWIGDTDPGGSPKAINGDLWLDLP
jgi:hypothetical protein